MTADLGGTTGTSEANCSAQSSSTSKSSIGTLIKRFDEVKYVVINLFHLTLELPEFPFSKRVSFFNFSSHLILACVILLLLLY